MVTSALAGPWIEEPTFAKDLCMIHILIVWFEIFLQVVSSFHASHVLNASTRLNEGCSLLSLPCLQQGLDSAYSIFLPSPCSITSC